MSHIANNTRTKHSGEIQFLNALCIDLKKFVLRGGKVDNISAIAGQEMHVLVPHFGDNIGLNRLEEFTAVIDKLAQCKEQVNFQREVKGTWLDSEDGTTGVKRIL